MKQATLYSLLLCLLEVSVLASIAYELTVSFDEVRTEKMLLCAGQRPADAVADFLIQNGLHTNFIPNEDMFRQIYEKTCGDSGLCDGTAKGSDSSPSRIVTKSDASIDIFWTQQESKKINVIIREGYHGTAIADCFCSKVVCTVREVAQLAVMADHEVQKRIELQAAEAEALEKAQFESSNHYVVLGLILAEAAAKGDTDMSTISDSAIKKAYLDLARRFHPDKHRAALTDWATERFKKIASAYDALSSTALRTAYDRSMSPRQHNQHQQHGGTYFNFGGVHVHIPAGGFFTFTFN